MKNRMLCLKVRIYCKYAMGMISLTTRNQKIINQLLKRNPIDSSIVVDKILAKHLRRIFNDNYLDFRASFDKLRILKVKKRKGIK
jgi:hypothetical protein